MKNVILILTAAGASTRLGTGVKKEYYPLNGGTVLSESARVFFESLSLSHVVVTIPKNHEEPAKSAFYAKYIPSTANVSFIEGSSTRQKSIYNALEFINSSYDKAFLENTVVLIHDAARPFVSREIVKNVYETCCTKGAAVPIIAPVDTQKEIAADGTIKKHLIRKDLGAVQTPQGFDFAKIYSCHKEALKNSREYTDDSEIWDSFPNLTGATPVFTVPGSMENKKITYIGDIRQMEIPFRIGFGTDLHKLSCGRDFYLGGVKIPSEKGEVAHSDGDVLLHAICDALLGACGLGDIGSYFPPEDPKWKNADSKVLAATIWQDVKKEGYKIGNMDCVLEFESPKFIPWRNKVISSIAEIFETEESRIFVKAKTNEKLDAVGKGDAIKAYCTCLLVRS